MYKRIISLVPSQTEFLHELGLENEVVGVTKFCIHPNKWFKNKARVGGTKTINFEKINSLNPDLIIANKEENTQAEIEILQKKYSVYISEIYTLDDAYQMMTDIGGLTDRLIKSKSVVSEVQLNFNNLQQLNKKVLYLIWKNPFMAAGRHTFINDVLNKCGLMNAIKSETSRYDELSLETISKLDLDYIFLSSEPYPFKQKDIYELQKITNAKIVLVDGEMFSWYGNRLLRFKAYWEDLIMHI